MSAGRDDATGVTAQANIVSHSPCSASPCRSDPEDSPFRKCGASSRWAAATDSECAVSPIAHRTLGTWVHNKAETARRANERRME